MLTILSRRSISNDPILGPSLVDFRHHCGGNGRGGFRVPKMQLFPTPGSGPAPEYVPFSPNQDHLPPSGEGGETSLFVKIHGDNCQLRELILETADTSRK